MTQTTFDDDELFGEAAAETRADVEAALDAARAELPTAESVWETEADNVLGVLNGLKSALDAGEAAVHLREAKKWFALGSRADAFEEPASIEADIEAVEDLLATVEAAHDEVSGLTGTIPQLRGTLRDVHADSLADDPTDVADETTAADDDPTDVADDTTAADDDPTDVADAVD